MSGLDLPLLGVEVVGSIADVLHQSEGMTLEAYLHQTTGRVGRQDDSLMS